MFVQSRLNRLGLCAGLSAIAVLMLALAPAANAGTITVSTTFDDRAGIPQCSLREAVESANTEVNFGGCLDANATLPDTIALGGGDYELSRVGADDTNVDGDLDVTNDLTIQGIGRNATGIDGNGGTVSDRVLDVHVPTATVTLSLSGLTVHDGAAPTNGGGIEAENNSILNLTNADVTGNRALGDGGGIHGTVNNNDANLVNSTVTGNVAQVRGGGIEISRANLTDSVVSGNNTGGDGGGMRAVTANLTNSSVTGNKALGGGGGIQTIDFGAAGTATLIASRVANNSAVDEGGGINTTDATLTDSTLSGNESASHGGGIFSDSGSVTVDRSTINGNDAGANGGGILFSPPFPDELNVTNSTLSGNRAAVHGGGISTDGTTNFSNATLTDNTADSDNAAPAGNGGGIAQFAGALGTKIGNTIVGGNRDLSGGGQDCSGTVSSQAYNFIGDPSGCSIVNFPLGNISGPSPLLDPLGANGGLTLTHALQPNSLEINAGYPGTGTGMPCEATDQRGLPRGGAAGRCDIGAFEVQGPAAVPVAAAASSSAPSNTPAAKKKCKKGRKLKKGKCVKKKK